MNIDRMSAFEKLDYIPYVSTITNLGALFYKYGLINPPNQNHPYIAYVKSKSISRCVALLVPYFGNAMVMLDDFVKASEPVIDEMMHDLIVHRGHEEDPKKVLERIAACETDVLDLSLKGIRAIPEEIGDLAQLTTLFLYTNRLSYLPYQLWQLRSLVTLDLSGNKFTTLPTELGQLSKLQKLILSYNKLTALPSEIGQLSELKEICICCNKITTLPKEMGNLTQLTRLIAYRNCLTALPSEIGLLSNLSLLNLEGNKIAHLPKEIGNLNLKELNLDNNALTAFTEDVCEISSLCALTLFNNKIPSIPHTIGKLTNLSSFCISTNLITSLPVEICALRNLVYLGVSYNRLTSLPPQMGNLVQLERLYFQNNPDLRELPLSLGEIPGLTRFILDQTGIDPAHSESILNQCRLMRRNEEGIVLALRLDKWRISAKMDVDFSRFDRFSLDQRIDLNLWLSRLEKTPDFGSQYTDLSTIVCRILVDVLEHPSFHELFFSEIRANSEDCEDRAAMSLNEIYTSWKILCCAESLSLKEKLKLMTGVAKTLRLRKEVARLLEKRREEESVEIYLYYETHLRVFLELVTAVKQMAHWPIGKRGWISVKKLIKEVNEHYFEELYELPIFQKMVQQDPLVKEEWEKIYHEQNEALDALGDTPLGIFADLDHMFEQGKILREWKLKKMEIARIWYNRIMK